MHTAVLARELRRMAGGKVPDLDIWMLRDPAERTFEANGKVLSLLGTVGEKVTAKEASIRLKKHRKTRQKNRPGKRTKK